MLFIVSSLLPSLLKSISNVASHVFPKPIQPIDSKFVFADFIIDKVATAPVLIAVIQLQSTIPNSAPVEYLNNIITLFKVRIGTFFKRRKFFASKV